MIFALFSLPNNLFCANNVRRIYILVNCLGLIGLREAAMSVDFDPSTRTAQYVLILNDFGTELSPPKPLE